MWPIRNSLSIADVISAIETFSNCSVLEINIIARIYLLANIRNHTSAVILSRPLS